MATSKIKGLPIGATKKVKIVDGPSLRDLDLALFDPYPCHTMRCVSLTFGGELCVVERCFKSMGAKITGVIQHPTLSETWKIEGRAEVPAGEHTTTIVYFEGVYSTQTRKGNITIKHGREFGRANS